MVSHVLGSVEKGGDHILKNLEVLKQKKFYTVSSFTGIVEFKDKCFVLNLKLLFIIVDCFSGKFSSKFFTLKLICFISFPGLSYLVLLMFVYFNKVYS